MPRYLLAMPRFEGVGSAIFLALDVFERDYCIVFVTRYSIMTYIFDVLVGRFDVLVYFFGVVSGQSGEIEQSADGTEIAAH